MMVSIKDDRYVPGLSRYTEAIHREGGKGLCLWSGLQDF